jgi:hypothetical protein
LPEDDADERGSSLRLEISIAIGYHRLAGKWEGPLVLFAFVLILLLVVVLVFVRLSGG